MMYLATGLLHSNHDEERLGDFVRGCIVRGRQQQRWGVITAGTFQAHSLIIPLLNIHVAFGTCLISGVTGIAHYRQSWTHARKLARDLNTQKLSTHTLAMENLGWKPHP